jgi:ABC-type phosphate/phosphonate transport system substrate-binding protein
MFTATARLLVASAPIGPLFVRSLVFALALSICGMGSLKAHPPATKPYAEAAGRSFGVFPYLPALTLDRVFSGIVHDLNQHISEPVQFRTKPTFEKYLEEMQSEGYDFILVHPFFYILAADRHNYIPLARLKESLHAVIVTHRHGPLAGLRDLTGKTLALPPELAAVSEIIRSDLIEIGLKSGENIFLQHFQSKASCVQAVTIGTADACGLPDFALPQLAEDGQMIDRLIYKSAPVPSLVVAAHQGVPVALRTEVRERLLGWSSDDRGRQILASGGWSGFVPALDGDFNEVRRRRFLASRLAQTD